MSISLRDFIKVSEKTAEASVLIANNDLDIVEYCKLLENLGYFRIIDTVDARKYFIAGKKVYGLVTDKNAKFFYTLAKDYAGGDIHLFDFVKKEKIWITPNRETSSFILIIRLQDLENFNLKDYDFNVVCESAYRK